MHITLYFLGEHILPPARANTCPLNDIFLWTYIVRVATLAVFPPFQYKAARVERSDQNRNGMDVN